MSTQSLTEEQLRWQLQLARKALEQLLKGSEMDTLSSVKDKARLEAVRTLELIK